MSFKLFACAAALSALLQVNSLLVPSVSSDPASYATETFAALSAAQPNSIGLNSADGLTLRGFLRGHKCLFDDSALRFGTIVFLLRGADSSQRFVYPLELETNKHLLPGTEAALVWFTERDAAMSQVKAALSKQFPALFAEQQGAAGQSLVEDLARFYRVMQYAIAGGVPQQFMRPDVLDYMAELYDEVGMDFGAVSAGVDAMEAHMKSKVDKKHWDALVAPAFASLRQAVDKMRRYAAGNPSHTLKTMSAAGALPDSWEAEPERGTLDASILLAQPLDLEKVPAGEREAVKRILEGLK